MKSSARFKFIFWLLSTAPLMAQHCPFDNTAILVAEVRDRESGEKLTRLSLSLRDETGEIVIDRGKDTLTFCLNPDSIADDWYPYNFQKIRYSFAEDNYILPLSFDFAGKKLFLQVNDPSGNYPSVAYALSAEDFYDLHENIGDWTELHALKETPPPHPAFDRLIRIALAPGKK